MQALLNLGTLDKATARELFDSLHEINQSIKGMCKNFQISNNSFKAAVPGASGRYISYISGNILPKLAGRGKAIDIPKIENAVIQCDALFAWSKDFRTKITGALQDPDDGSFIFTVEGADSFKVGDSKTSESAISCNKRITALMKATEPDPIEIEIKNLKGVFKEIASELSPYVVITDSGIDVISEGDEPSGILARIDKKHLVPRAAETGTLAVYQGDSYRILEIVSREKRFSVKQLLVVCDLSV
jgi:hypothetical protein